MNKQRKRILLYVVGVIIIGFILLSFMVSFFPVSIADREFSEEVQEHQYPILDSLMKLISWFGYMPYSIIMVLASALVFYVSQYKKEAFFLVLTLLSGLVSSSVKILINRPRPTGDMVRIIEKATRQSFPSGHVLFYVVYFGFLTLLMYHLSSVPKYARLTISIVSLFLIFTVPVSRVYLGAHWFTDVVGGGLLGIVCLFILGFIYLDD